MATWTLTLGSHRLTVEGFREGRIRNVTKVLVSNRRTYAVNDKGQMFASIVEGNRLILRNDQRAIRLFDVAAKFGLLPKDVVKELKVEHERIAKIKRRHWSAQEIRHGAEGLGVELPATIKRSISMAKAAYKKTV